MTQARHDLSLLVLVEERPWSRSRFTPRATSLRIAWVLPKKIPRGDGNVIFSPGFIGNMLTGAVAASVSWLLYGPLSQIQIGTAPGTQTMMVATLGGAVLIGMVGSAWLINAVGKNLFQAAAYHAASAPSSPDASKHLILADSGGSNGCRPRQWKQQLQEQLSDRYGLTVVVWNSPTGCSKWNPIEHRLFSYISQHWVGCPGREL
jgi:hypothetical protein